MAYGALGEMPVKGKKKIGKAGGAGKQHMLTAKTQDGKTGLEGASDIAQLHFGDLPSTAPLMANADSVESNTQGESSRGAGTVKKTKGNPKSASMSHDAAGKKPAYPGSHGGAHTGSVDTMTKLMFHPKGGFGNKTHAKAKRPEHSGKFKDSGMKGPPQVAKDNVQITRGRA